MRLRLFLRPLLVNTFWVILDGGLAFHKLGEVRESWSWG